MSQQSSGLRFDIYERVHLPDNTIGVKEINGIELTPEISVVAQGEQAVLKGYLALTGTYAGEGETRNEEELLTHRIPVEITLPLNRVENVNDIRVEIENFDVDVLSPRTLNVTGVLSLGGIEMASALEPAWREEEEVVFSHRVEPAAPAPEPEPEPVAALAAEAPAPEPEPIPISAPAAVDEPTATIAAANEPEAAPIEASEAANESPNEAANEAPNEAPNEPEAIEALEAQEAPAPEKQEIKIAFAGKSPEAEPSPIGVNAIMSMAGAAAAEKRPESPPASEAAAAPAESSGEGKDRLEWKKLFLRPNADETSFRKVRMCIAQKEDTIETIADRYQKNVRELMLYNRINDQYLQEGQVVYIP